MYIDLDVLSLPSCGWRVEERGNFGFSELCYQEEKTSSLRLLRCEPAGCVMCHLAPARLQIRVLHVLDHVPVNHALDHVFMLCTLDQVFLL